ncbi:MAG: pitrilysin family protein [Bacillota bacterium]|nr:pitrilysin family protein [Bacillota bacterium]
MHEKRTLENGITVVYEKLPDFKSVAVGIWVKAGSANEAKDINGISHFIEHMMFKGTKKRSARDIALEMDNIGGQLNAFTSKECTCYHAKVMDKHLGTAVDVLCDIIQNSVFDKNELEKEKGVVLEEVSMVEDTPEELVFDILAQGVFSGHPLGQPVVGNRDAIRAFSRAHIISFMGDCYTTENAVVSAAGNFDENILLQMLEEKMALMPIECRGACAGGERPVPEHTSGFMTKKKENEQVHVCLGLPGYPMADKRSYSLNVLNNILGGGMSSRLFQAIREEKGLAYSVYSYPSFYANTGLFTLYAGTSPKYLKQVIEMMLQEMRKLKKEGLTDEEVAQAKEQLKGNYILGLESTGSKMIVLGKSQTLLGRVIEEEETLRKVEEVTRESVAGILEEVFDEKRMFAAVVGNTEDGFDLSDYIDRGQDDGQA